MKNPIAAATTATPTTMQTISTTWLDPDEDATAIEHHQYICSHRAMGVLIYSYYLLVQASQPQSKSWQHKQQNPELTFQWFHYRMKC